MWLYVAIISYSLNAGVYVADKFLLSKKVHSSIAYAFYVGIWSIFNAFLLFFDPWLPSGRELLLDLSAGIFFLITLVFWYKALHQSEATRIVPIVGALIPAFSLFFSFIFFGEELTERQFLAFLILIIGGVLISIKHTKLYEVHQVVERFKQVFGNVLGPIHARYRPTQRLLINAVISAIFFALFYVLMKYIYIHQASFIGAFVWSRFGSFIGAIFFLFVPSWRGLIKEHEAVKRSPRQLFFFIGVRLLAAIAFILLNSAIKFGSVALVNSLQGVQYVFLLLIILFLSARYPHVLKEEMGGGVALQKILGALLVVAGLYMLAFKM